MPLTIGQGWIGIGWLNFKRVNTIMTDDRGAWRLLFFMDFSGRCLSFAACSRKANSVAASLT